MAKKEKIELFFDKIFFDESGCWLWTGALSNGYGLFRNEQSKQGTAHNFSYRYFKGKISDHLQIDHLCRIRSCVNPEHLEAVTPRDNLDRANHWSKINREKRNCPKGHEYSMENTQITSIGSRICKRCNRERMRKLREKTIKLPIKQLKKSCINCGILLRKNEICTCGGGK